MNRFVPLLLFVVTCSSSGSDAIGSDFSSKKTEIIKEMLSPFRLGRPPIFSKEKQLAKKLYTAIEFVNVAEVKKLLQEGADPNYCLGENGWIDSNPLNVIAGTAYNTYYRKLNNKKIPNPTPLMDLLSELLKAGADINRRPYVWYRVYLKDNAELDNDRYQGRSDGLSDDSAEMQKRIDSKITDTNRLLEAFLKAGADPDKKGSPYPYDWRKTRGKTSDNEANKYFSKGNRAINEAIEKGIVWESQVDLLLKYTRLDEESIEAAKRSGDPKMIEKIKGLWKKQQQESKMKETRGRSTQTQTRRNPPNPL